MDSKHASHLRWSSRHTVAVIVGVVILAAVLIALSSYISSDRPDTVLDREHCIRNMQVLVGAKREYAVRQSLTNGAAVSFRALHDAGLLPQYPVCPRLTRREGSLRLAEASYSLEAIGAPPRCRVAPSDHELRPATGGETKP